DERYVLRDAVGRTAHRSRHVRAVAVAIVRAQAIVDCGETGNYAPGKLRVGRTNAGIDDVSFYAGAGGVVVIIPVKRQIALIDAIQSPGCAGLGRNHIDYTVFFDKRDSRIVCEFGRLRFRHAHRETLDCPVVSKAAGSVSTEVTRQP